MIKKILKAVLPATYRKIGKSEQKILATVIEQYTLLNRRIDSLESTLFQKIQDEANWKRDDLVRNIEENKNLLRLLDFAQENMFYAMYKKDGESEIDAKKRFFKSIPEATGGLRLLQKGNVLLLKEFDRLCKEYKLPYFFAGGNLIGAVRGGKQIPWDDDVDVVMLRSDIEVLREKIKDSLDFRITVLFDWWGKCKQIRFKFKDEKYPLFLDIFIYDVYEGAFSDNPESYNHIEMTRFFESSALPEVNYWKEHPCLDESDPYFPKIEKIFNRFSMHEKSITGNFDKYPEKTVIRAMENVFAYPHHRFYKYEQIFPTKTLLFEGDEYLVPNDYMYFLKDQYGDIFKFPNDIFTHFEHIPSNELESVEFKNLISELFRKYGGIK
ncbi:MAG: LicD family protein [Treponema sp.]|nr:LicD family protein [Treponema sp.]